VTTPERPTGRRCPGDPDPSIQALHDALAFATAAVAGDRDQLQAIVDDALASDHASFVDALATTVAVIAEESTEAGADIPTLLRDLALGIHVASLRAPTAGDDPTHTDRPPHRGD
jgi:hypothetical protein